MTNHAMTDSVMTKHMMRTQTEPEDMRAQALSALIDGELSDDKAAQTIKHLDQDATAHLAEYLAIGDAMRGLSGQRSGFTQGVMAALKDEPAILAPIRKPTNRRPALWLAAATMAAISWSLWQSDPRNEVAAPFASLQQPANELTARSAAAMPYLAAHQDFAQAVISEPEMRFSNASLEIRQ